VWLRRPHDEVHVTTVFVTHDQEEALEVADEIVVINEGRVEQVGTPDQLYDEPAGDFVMGFLGPITRLGGHLVRPHDIELCPEASRGVPGVVQRITRVGFEVRVDIATAEQVVLATLTRAHFVTLDLEVGTRVGLAVVPNATTVDAGGGPAPGAAELVGT
jgi:sulfate transport system ATP-binding protein